MTFILFVVDKQSPNGVHPSNLSKFLVAIVKKFNPVDKETNLDEQLALVTIYFNVGQEFPHLFFRFFSSFSLFIFLL